MKFTDGQWLIRQGISILNPISVVDIVMAENQLTVYAACREINDRGDTLSCPLLTFYFFAPQPDIIGVRITHFEGERRQAPEFVLNRQADCRVAINDNLETVSMTNGNLSVRIHKGGCWKVEFLNNNQLLTGSSGRNSGYILTDRKENFFREQLDLGVGEYVYGLGERFTALVKNGQTVDIWNCDGGTNSEQAYKNIPFYLTNKGYGVFVNHPERVSFEVASENVSKVQFSVAGEYLEYYLINGPTPKQVLKNYTLLTGRPALPPAWSFGLWLSTSFTTNYDETTVNGFIEGMIGRDLPVHVFHFDCFWMREFHWCDFEWDRRMFPEPAPILARLKEKGLKICVWVNPYIAQRSSLFAEGKAKGYLLKKPNGDVWQWDLWQAGMGLVDFTNPEACHWFTGLLEKLLDVGVDCFKTDFGERIPTDVVYFDGSEPFKMHNYYTYLYNKLVFELLEKRFGKGRATVFARSATVGGQCFPVHWGGDCWATYESMAESLRGGLSLGLSGFGFWSHDIGGFEKTAPADLYKRWVAFGMLSSHSRLHGSSSYRVPWLFDEEAVDVVRYFTKLKCRLMPYLFSVAKDAAEQGLPVMRAMMLEFPDDPACLYLDQQYMLGESLLVAPVFRSDGTVSYYLPAGTWTHLITGARIAGATWRQEKHSYLSLPLLVRENSILAVGNGDCRPDYDFAADVTLQLFGWDDGYQDSQTVFNLDGNPELTVTVRRQNNMLVVESQGVGKPWELLWRGGESLQVKSGGTAVRELDGLRIKPESNNGEIQLELS